MNQTASTKMKRKKKRGIDLKTSFSTPRCWYKAYSFFCAYGDAWLYTTPIHLEEIPCIL